jgi:hypothetical protein
LGFERFDDAEIELIKLMILRALHLNRSTHAPVCAI